MPAFVPFRGSVHAFAKYAADVAEWAPLKYGVALTPNEVELVSFDDGSTR